MFFHIFYPLVEYFQIFNVFRYITFRAVGAFITALLFSFFIGPKIIKLLKDKKAVETISEDVPSTHKKKEGTPSMGGLIILASILLSTTLWNNLINIYILLLLVTLLWLGGVGFIDDYFKNILKKKNGLRPKYKLLGQTILSLIVGCTIYFNPEMSEATRVMVPFLKSSIYQGIQLSWFFIPFTVFMVVGTSNAVNLTDGLDGLATGLVALTTLGLGVIAYVKGHSIMAEYLNLNYIPEAGELTIFMASMIGATLGFLWFNAHPSSVFMGDSGSLCLGGLLAVISIFLQEQLLFGIMGGLFVVEALSSMFQTYYFKYTRKKSGTGIRFFLKAPIHHHFEMKGMPESKIVTRMWIIGMLLVAIGLGTLKLR